MYNKQIVDQLLLRDRLTIAAAQGDGKLSDDPQDQELGWIFYTELSKQLDQQRRIYD